jgi:hypothetical protein
MKKSDAANTDARVAQLLDDVAASQRAPDGRLAAR